MTEQPADETGPETEQPAAAGEQPAEETITVYLANATRTSAGRGLPGHPAVLPAEEARELLRQGLAVRAP